MSVRLDYLFVLDGIQLACILQIELNKENTSLVSIREKSKSQAVNVFLTCVT